MKALLSITAFAIAVAMAGPSYAQQRTTDNPPAVANPNDANKTMAAPVAGKNSFTEAQAKERLEEHGYKNITKLVQDAESIWRGEAVTPSGTSVKIAVDYQGNITVN